MRWRLIMTYYKRLHNSLSCLLRKILSKEREGKMLDTVKLCIPLAECKVNSPDIFVPTIRENLKRGVKYICMPDKDWLRCGKYFPKLIAFKDFNNENQIIVEFSAPKLVFGNNFEELDTEDFAKVIDELSDRLTGLDIEISKDNLEQARVLAIHYSKNIELENTTATCITNTIEKLDITKRLDIAKTDYKNGGQTIRFHANSYEVAFYDKVADLMQSKISEKRAVESENIVQQDFLSKLSGKEVLRMEVRLNKSKKIRHIFEKCGINNTDLTFKQLFSNEIFQKVLNYFWNEFVEKSIYVVCQAENDTSVILSKCATAGFSKSKSLKIAGILSSIKENGCRYLKDKLKYYGSYVKDIEIIGLDDNYLLKQFRTIRVKLQRMIPLRI